MFSMQQDLSIIFNGIYKFNKPTISHNDITFADQKRKKDLHISSILKRKKYH